ncbi:MAG: DUF1385 domain-containing protein [Roseiflexus sp.]|jgi:uncharacterized protein YqhQ|nr:DUF1385 domain-containing protein [Roseiflexus sp.]MBO9335954.1 DUF1385 domain-containing protein [Roseiflexus sp.]MBO9366673.1 DUF1385 domain-containing protein [Roseiflexus sp.]MBO9381815.1 DUF1385 domain-containing protein [Roseiflexus sp.]MBO9390506.1 DUF1385 domain-containing protein [Roseiflexus sp.]
MGERTFSYGGQAVLEGVMMRGLRQATVAVRTPSGEIVFRHEPLNVERRRMWENLPFLRGILMLWDTLNLGVRALNFSASAALGEEEQPQSKGAVALTLVIALAFAFGLFFVVPLLIASLLERVGATPLMRDAAEGFIQLGIFIGYLALIGRMPDIQRTFGYHGAEHKTINAYEAGAPLTVESVRSFTLLHPRCGTSFLLVVVVLSIPFFALFGSLPLGERLLSRIILVPVIAAVSYELLRLLAAHFHRGWVRRLVAPSLALQRLTTREPDDTMIAVAIAALIPVLAADGIVPDAFDESLAHGVARPSADAVLA